MEYYLEGSGTAHATIRYGVTRADIRVDSNNATPSGATEPIIGDADEQIEFSTKAEHIGNILLETSGDADLDGVMDTALVSTLRKAAVFAIGQMGGREDLD